MTKTAASAAFESAYQAAGALMATQSALRDFAAWTAAKQARRPPTHIPASDLVQSWAEGENSITSALRCAVRRAAPFAQWRQTYTEDEVGLDYLQRYGWFELLGPSGHFLSGDLRAYIGYWGAHLHYPWHVHAAEEVYFVLAGNALFESDGIPSETLTAGQSRLHVANQPHAITTKDSPLLVFALWRGAGMEEHARLGRT